MTGRGGWPMTVFLDPDGRPFFGGTYFPKDDRHGHARLRRACSTRSTRRGATGATTCSSRPSKLTKAIERTGEPRRRDGDGPAPSPDDPRPRRTSRSGAQFDPRFGGFGPAPKFPQAMTLDFLLRTCVARPGARDARDGHACRSTRWPPAGCTTRSAAAFHRYSVDAHWLVPHFEKMLYDQALLAGAYLHGWLVTGEPRYRRVVEETIEYVLRDLRHADGGFFSAEDADSEGVEGKFYVLVARGARRASAATTPPRSSATSASPRAATSRTRTPATAATSSTSSTAPRTGPTRSQRALPALFARARARASVPASTTRCCSAWNALFLRSLAEAAAALERDDWMDAARDERAVPARRDCAATTAGCSARGRTAAPTILAYAEDYAALLEALSPWPRSTTSRGWRTRACVADELLRLFADDERRRLLHHRHRRRGAHRAARRTTRTTRRRRRTRSPPTGCSGSPRSRASADYEARARGGGSATLAPVLGEHPTAFAYLLGALERLVHAAARGRDRRRRRRPGDRRAPARGARDGCCRPSVHVSAAPGTGADAHAAPRRPRPRRRASPPRTCASTTPAGCRSRRPRTLRGGARRRACATRRRGG